jgi:Asp/Glu/hydantoin racemase
VELGGIAESVMAAKYVRLVQTADSIAVVRGILEAEARGFDAAVIGNIFDPGLYEARQLLRIPVVGLAEAGLLLGRVLAGRLAVVCSNALAIPRVRENAARYGVAPDGLVFYALHSDIPSLAAAFSDPAARARILDDVRALGTRALDDGCELLLIGSGILNALVHGDAGALPLPVLDVSAAAVQLAVTLVRLRQLAGIGPSRVGTFAAPPREVLVQIARTYGFTHLP